MKMTYKGIEYEIETQYEEESLKGPQWGIWFVKLVPKVGPILEGYIQGCEISDSWADDTFEEVEE